METDRVEPNERDLEALKNYQESRKRPRSGHSSPSDECLLDSLQIKKEKLDEGPWQPTKSVWLEDPKGLYGIKPEYLSILGVEPPLNNWVYVENFRCDKSELREVLELAGYVVVCSVVHGHQKHAKVMYSHVLEALQAVSMFNKQMFYGRALSVTMMKFPLNTVMLPKGLPNIGPGFGNYGKPLRDIVKQFERFVNKEPHTVNTCLFYDPNDIDNRPRSTETVGSITKEDINERFQFKQFIIRNVEDDDAKSETDSRKEFVTGNSNDTGSKTTPLPKYSPRSPTRSPNVTDDNRASSDSGLKKIQSSTFNNTGTITVKKFNTANSSINQNDSTMGPVQNSVLLTPTGSLQGAMMGPNPLSASFPRFGPNPPIVGSSGPRFGINVGSVVGTSMSGPVDPRFGPNSSISGLSGPLNRPNAPVVGSYVAPVNNQVLRPSAPMAGPKSGPNSTGLLPAPPTTVQFRNLPPTTTFPILCEKMAQCGQVMSLQLTTPGCATVVFSHSAHAQRCFQRYNNYTVDGCVIEARVI